MRGVPECLNRRYKAVDDLIQQLSSSVRSSGANSPTCYEKPDPAIKLMCDFWNILKEDPECDLKKQVKQRMGLTTPSIPTTYPQAVTCYNIEDREQTMWKECAKKIKDFCCHNSKPDSDKPTFSKCKSENCRAEAGHCKVSKPHESPTPITPQSCCAAEHPLNKALCNVNQAATFESECNNKLHELILTQLKLTKQIEIVEMREKDGINLLTKADCMWSCMEESYKRRLQDSTDRQNVLIKQLQEIDASQTKWRKNKKELEVQIANAKKTTQGLSDQLAQKKTDMKFLKIEVEDLKKRVESNKTEVDSAKKALEYKKRNSEVKVSNMMYEVSRLQKLLGDENKNKLNKEQSGNKFVKEARQELQKLCRVLLKKKLENEDLRAEKAALLDEIDLLNVTMDQCKNRCKLKQDTLNEDLAKLDEQIATYKIKCIQCNQCTDTNDVTRFCTDCPRCIEDRNCLYDNGYCTLDSSCACVCMSVKEKFLDNVFDNMYTVLERQSKNGQGKQIAESIMGCLKCSTNGKLNTETKKMLQDFILSTLRKNLNLTIVGGAVKTRCELDPETYERLMLCLKNVYPEKIPKEKAEKATEKKDPCKHWRGRVYECHCPSGPKDCICSKKAPEPPPMPNSKPEEKTSEDVKPGEVLMCPHKEKSTACGPDCAAFDTSMKVGAEMSKWRPDPCSGPACSFKNVRAVQCILGPEVLNMSNNIAAAAPILPIGDKDNCDHLMNSSCSKSCTTKTFDTKGNYPRERIIEEVMGKYIEVSPIQKVTSGKESPFRRSVESMDSLTANDKRYVDEGCYSPPENNIYITANKIRDIRTTSNINVEKYKDRLTANSYYKLEPKAAKIHLLSDSSQSIVLKDAVDVEELKKERKVFIRRHVDWDVPREHVVTIFPDSEHKENSNTTEMDFIVILDSKFVSCNSKISVSTSPFTSSYSVCDSRGASLDGSDDDGSSVGYVVRNIDICNAAKDLIKEVIVSESKAKNWGPDIEWMTIPSFINKLTRCSYNSFSNSLNEEVEITNTTLEALKSSKKEISNNDLAENLLSKTFLEKVKENPNKSSNKYTTQGSQFTSKEITKPVDTAFILCERTDQKPLSNSSTSAPVKKTESHSRCCKYFMQSLINQAGDSFHNMSWFDTSSNSFSKFAKITYRKPVNMFEYLSENISSTSTSSTST